MSPSLTRVACIGECMIELSELGDGWLSRTHGGDTPGIDVAVEAEPVSDVVDTAAAGDSFAAAYLAARLDGAEPAAAARAGHELAATVIRYLGAIIPPAAMSAAANQGKTSGT